MPNHKLPKMSSLKNSLIVQYVPNKCYHIYDYMQEPRNLVLLCYSYRVYSYN
jgi:hypothetical protein